MVGEFISRGSKLRAPKSLAVIRVNSPWKYWRAEEWWNIWVCSRILDRANPDSAQAVPAYRDRGRGISGGCSPDEVLAGISDPRRQPSARVGQNESDADDLVQDTLVKAI